MSEEYVPRHRLEKRSWHPWSWVVVCGDSTWPMIKGRWLKCERYRADLERTFNDGVWVGQGN
jgi:hypothetical protein